MTWTKSHRELEAGRILEPSVLISYCYVTNIYKSQQLKTPTMHSHAQTHKLARACWLTMLFSGEWKLQESVMAQIHFKLFLTSISANFPFPKQVTWPSPTPMGWESISHSRRLTPPEVFSWGGRRWRENINASGPGRSCSRVKWGFF